MGIFILAILTFGIYVMARAVVRKVFGLIQARKNISKPVSASCAQVAVAPGTTDGICWEDYDVPAFKRRGISTPTFTEVGEFDKFFVRMKNQLDSLTKERLESLTATTKKRSRKVSVAILPLETQSGFQPVF